MRGKVNTLLYCSQIMAYLIGMGEILWEKIVDCANALQLTH
jgi:hypothetical protein